MGVDMSKIRARRLEHKRMDDERKNKASFMELKEGDTKVRILPPWSADGMWCKEARYHYNIKEKSAIACLRATFNQPCPACEVVDQLFKTKSQDDRDFAFKVIAKSRFFANALDLSKNDGKVYILAFGPQVEKQVIAIMDPSSEAEAGGDTFGMGDITDPASGRNLMITKTVPADKRQTSYTVIPSQTPTPVANWDAIKSQLHDLDSLVAKDVVTYEEMNAMLTNSEPPTAAPEPTVIPIRPGRAEVNPSDEFVKPGAVAAAIQKSAPVDEFGRPSVSATSSTKAVPVTPAPVATKNQDLSKTLAALRAQRNQGASR